MSTTPQEQAQIILQGIETIYSERELLEKLKQAVAQDRPLRIKLGLDPTAPDIHLGHTVQLRKLRQFQDLGHRAVLIIGDFTARIGDPSGRSKTRPVLNERQVEDNAQTYFEQAGKILDLDPAKIEVRYNSEWLEPLSFVDVLRLAGKVTIGQILKRDDFRKRLNSEAPIGLHELMYPLMQAYDSVAVHADVEMGGTDQTFNLLLARELQQEDGQEPQVVIVRPLLVGLDGTEKMSKSLGNYVGLTDPPELMFEKILSVPDQIMGSYYTLLTDTPPEQIEVLVDPSQTHPKQTKMKLAQIIVSQYHSHDAAQQAAERFDRVHVQRELPQQLPEVVVTADLMDGGKIWLPKLLVHCRLCASTSEARRLITQGGVLVDNRRWSDPQGKIELQDGIVLQIGRRKFARIKLAPCQT